MFTSLLEYLYCSVINYDDVIRELDKVEIHSFIEQYITSLLHQMFNPIFFTLNLCYL